MPEIYITHTQRERENNFEIQQAQKLRNEARRLRELMAELRLELKEQRQKSEALRFSGLKSVI
jgi:hypothetical protein